MPLSTFPCGTFYGTYAGYIVISDTAVENGILFFMVNNSDFIIIGVLSRAYLYDYIIEFIGSPYGGRFISVVSILSTVRFWLF